MRAQRSLNKSRVPEMAKYIVENPESYIFSALTASVNADVQFEAPHDNGNPASRVGTLTVPMSATFIINDGQHRRAAIQQALSENPTLGHETIAIVVFIDVGLERCQQMFADLNRHATRPSKSIGILYDHRDPMAEITRMVVSSTPLLRDLTEMETNNLAPRSRKLFTLSALHTATTALLQNVRATSPSEKVNLAIAYWRLVSSRFPIWNQVFKNEVSAGEVRRDFIHTHSIALHAFGNIGNSVLRESQSAEDWEKALGKLGEIDWHRSNTEVWEGRATNAGKVSKSRTNVELTTSYIRNYLGLTPTTEEEQAELTLQKEKDHES